MTTTPDRKTFRFDLEQVTLLEAALDYALSMSKEHDGLDLERAQRRILYRLAGRFEGAREDLTPQPPEPHDCDECGTSINDCDDRIHGSGKACCSRCGRVDTHGDTPSAYTERLAARGIR
jgi:hypothetical protein